MLRWISIFRGWLIIMGHHARSEALFYYFRLEDQVPEHHLLRLIDKHSSLNMRIGLLAILSDVAYSRLLWP